MRKRNRNDDIHYGIISQGLVTLPIFFAAACDGLGDDLRKIPYADTSLFDISYFVWIAVSITMLFYWGLFRKILGVGGFMGEKGFVIKGRFARYTIVLVYLLLIFYFVWYTKLR